MDTLDFHSKIILTDIPLQEAEVIRIRFKSYSLLKEAVLQTGNGDHADIGSDIQHYGTVGA